MNVAPRTKNEIIEALLGDDEEIDFEDAKEVSQPPNELFDRQRDELLPKVIQAKEAYLGRKFVRSMDHTNPKGERFIYGKFGARNATISTLLYLDPTSGWVVADPGLIKEDDEDEFADEDFKEVYGGKERPRYLALGSYSNGTMNVEHLVPRFLSVLRSVDPGKAAKLAAEYEALQDPDDAEFCLEDLFSALEEHAPPYTYFGSHEGDGADYGVWISHESIEEALQNEELRPMRNGESFVPGETDVVLLDDSGNYLALLNGQSGEKIWEI